MTVFPKRKSLKSIYASLLVLALTTFPYEASSVEVAAFFQSAPKVAQAPGTGDSQTKAPARPVDEAECQDTVKLYLSLSATHNKAQPAAEALIETIYRHETMQRLVMIAAAAGCGMRPFIDEEVRRNKR